LSSSARELLKGVADREVLGDLPEAAMSRGQGLGYFVETVRGDWHTAEQELRRAYDELSSMGDKSYLASSQAGRPRRSWTSQRCCSWPAANERQCPSSQTPYVAGS
jgi:hypothetical protein